MLSAAGVVPFEYWRPQLLRVLSPCRDLLALPGTWETWLSVQLLAQLSPDFLHLPVFHIGVRIWAFCIADASVCGSADDTVRRS